MPNLSSFGFVPGELALQELEPTPKLPRRPVSFLLGRHCRSCIGRQFEDFVLSAEVFDEVATVPVVLLTYLAAWLVRTGVSLILVHSMATCAIGTRNINLLNNVRTAHPAKNGRWRARVSHRSGRRVEADLPDQVLIGSQNLDALVCQGVLRPVPDRLRSHESRFPEGAKVVAERNPRQVGLVHDCRRLFCTLHYCPENIDTDFQR
jgi:hypothetical protein